MKKSWVYQIRGLAIIAVVVCHQQGILHDTEVLQLFSLYSVTTLVFLMGVTKSFSLKKYYSVGKHERGVLAYSLNSLVAVLCSYVVATFVYTYRSWGGGKLQFSIKKYLGMFGFPAPLLYSVLYYFIIMGAAVICCYKIPCA